LRHGARSRLGAGLALAAMALASVARVDARTVNLGLCYGACVGPVIDDPPAAKPHTARITLSHSRPGRTSHPNDPGPALVLERRAAPAALAGGLPSPLSPASGEASRAVTPYDYFEDVAGIPLPAGAWAEFAAASFFLFAPSFLDRLTFTDGLSVDPPPM